MIFKKQAIYIGIKYTRVEGENYFGHVPFTRCEIYNCKYKDNIYECVVCNRVMKKTGAHKVNITFGYMPIK